MFQNKNVRVPTSQNTVEKRIETLTKWTPDYKKEYNAEYHMLNRVLKMGKRQREEEKIRLENKRLFEQLQGTIFACENVEGEII